MTSQNELIPMNAGEWLALERERAGLTLEEAAGRCRMKPSLLIAIEQGHVDDIPSVYLKGHLRRYANVLGADPAEIERRLAGVQGREPAVRSVFTAPRPRGSGERWLKISTYLAASAVIGALAWQFTHEAVRFSQGETALSAGTLVPAEAAGGSEDRRPLATHLNASIASVEVLRQERERAGAAEAAWAAIDGGGDSTPSTLPEGSHRLNITTSADSWVEIIGGDGARLEMDLIRAGTEREYVGVAPVQVMIGRASAVMLVVDGEPMDLAPHADGNVARLSIGAELAAAAAPGDATEPDTRQ